MKERSRIIWKISQDVRGVSVEVEQNSRTNRAARNFTLETDTLKRTNCHEYKSDLTRVSRKFSLTALWGYISVTLAFSMRGVFSEFCDIIMNEMVV